MDYLLTFTCYGCHLHGAESGSVDRNHNRVGTAYLGADRARGWAEARLMRASRYILTAGRRPLVLAAIEDRCADREWDLLAAHVRSTHVHAVVGASRPPGLILANLKAAASARLKASGNQAEKRWTRRGSARWLFTPAQVSAAIRYVVDGQGAPMSVYEDRSR